MEINIFPDGLSEITDIGFIPRIVRDDERLKVHKRYYFPEFNQKMKCTDVEIINDIEYYYLSNDNFQYVMSYPISHTCFVFTKDKYDIMSRHIINSNQVYRGYQLKWWFYNHNYTRYNNFIKLLSDICDDDIYKIYGRLEYGQYVDAKFILKYKRE